MRTAFWSQPADSTQKDFFQLQGRHLDDGSHHDAAEIVKLVAESSRLANRERTYFSDGSWAVRERKSLGNWTRVRVLAEVRTFPTNARNVAPDGITMLVEHDVTWGRQLKKNAREALIDLQQFALDTGQAIDETVAQSLEKYIEVSGRIPQPDSNVIQTLMDFAIKGR